MPAHGQPALGAHEGAEGDGFYRIHWYHRGAEYGAEVHVELHPPDERMRLGLEVPEAWESRIERVTYYGRYEGYDENGNRRSRDWHGYTKAKQPAGHLGISKEAPYRTEWNLSMLPSQQQVSVRTSTRAAT